MVADLLEQFGGALQIPQRHLEFHQCQPLFGIAENQQSVAGRDAVITARVAGIMICPLALTVTAP
ncbi:hypothetical protein IU459_31655 [Nocardia amamiensis]|uniref:Uncharacterized protein n=1 Tax=Nocardia amamiensis TaxID=404578 RepID=A0ABS0CZP5_9NOCA|nr:hypothetical protein [Nocardia amamiensis]MBF6302067.1 hypothetical protein [Nocardia amamiensis]